MIDFNFIKWIPDDDVIPMYDLLDFGFDKTNGEFFVIIIPDYYKIDNDNIPNIKISWHTIVANMISNESYRADTWIGKDDEVWCFYKSSSSDFLNFCCNDTKSEHLEKKDVTHYLLICSNWIIDILSTDEPIIQFLNVV